MSVDIQKKTEEAEIAQLNLDNLPEFVWIPDFISIAGSVVYGVDRDPNDLDIIVRCDNDGDKFKVTLDKSLRLKLDRILLDRVGTKSDKWKSIDWIESSFGPNWKYLSLWDLVLRPKKPELHEIDEPQFEESFYKECSDTKQIIDDKIKNPEKFKSALLADLRYLGNVGYSSLKAGKIWGTWSKLELLSYFAKIVDALRSIGVELTAPKIGDEKYKTPYWQCYYQAKRYLKKPEFVEIEKPFIKESKLFITKEDEHIVTSVVYPVDEEDTQGDVINEKEIREASNWFMEHSGKILVSHDGKPIKVNLLENFLAPVDYHVTDAYGNFQSIRKGSWVMSIRILIDSVWNQIKDGDITGFSIGGKAQA